MKHAARTLAACAFYLGLCATGWALVAVVVALFADPYGDTWVTFARIGVGCALVTLAGIFAEHLLEPTQGES